MVNYGNLFILVQGQIFLTLLILFRINSVLGQGFCSQFSNCGCKYSNGDTVDLSPLANSNGQSRFTDVSDSIGERYSWNPCNAFTEGDDCTDVAVCNIHQNIPNPAYFPIGTQDTANFSMGSDGNLLLQYDFLGTGGARRSSFITLLCDYDTEGSFVAMGENPLGSGLYYFALSSKYVCPPQNLSQISAGSIILIVVFVAIVLYLVLGIVFQKFVRKAQGKELIPNYVFWSALPMYIISGIMFIICCKKKGYTNMSSR